MMKGKEKPTVYLFLLTIFLSLSVIGCSGNQALPTLVPTAAVGAEVADIERLSSTTVPLPTATLGHSVEEALEVEIKAALDDYDYEQQQVLVEGIEIRADELVVRLKRRGPPSGTDYFGQLGIIHGVVAANEPDVDRVRTIDVDGQNGFIVRMGDLLDFYHNRLDFEEYRSRWEFFEP